MAEGENKSTASLVLGIISLFGCLSPLAGFPVSIIGLVLGIRKKYKVGIVLNAIGLVLDAFVMWYMREALQLLR